MQLKRRLYQLDLQDTELTVYLHNPSVENFDTYLQKVVGVQSFGSAMVGMGSGAAMVIPEQAKQDMLDIVAMVTDIIEDGQRRPILPEEVTQLTGWDCMAIVNAVSAMAEKAANPTMAAATQTPEMAQRS